MTTQAATKDLGRGKCALFPTCGHPVQEDGPHFPYCSSAHAQIGKTANKTLQKGGLPTFSVGAKSDELAVTSPSSECAVMDCRRPRLNATHLCEEHFSASQPLSDAYAVRPSMISEDSAPHDHQNNEGALEAVRTILRFLGEDPDAPALRATPQRYLRALREMSTRENVGAILGENFEMVKDEGELLNIVAQVDIRFSSLCQHHMLPFYGWVDIAYMPALDTSGLVPMQKLLGLSRLARLVTAVSRSGLQLQESITTSILSTLKQNECARRGALVVVRARHGCMSCRGVQQQALTITQATYGALAEEPALRAQAEAIMHTARSSAAAARR